MLVWVRVNMRACLGSASLSGVYLCRREDIRKASQRRGEDLSSAPPSISRLRVDEATANASICCYNKMMTAAWRLSEASVMRLDAVMENSFCMRGRGTSD